MNARTREEEYLRRMKALGYEPDLRGMDDGDIEWELSKMEEDDLRREAPPQQTLRTVYRPVDPGLKARILRMFGQPYDPTHIDPREEFYIGGWDNGDYADEPLPIKTEPNTFAPSRSGVTRPGEPHNPWKLNWDDGIKFGGQPPGASTNTNTANPYNLAGAPVSARWGDTSERGPASYRQDALRMVSAQQQAPAPDETQSIANSLSADAPQNETKNEVEDEQPKLVFDPLENMRVRGGLKVHTFGDQPERISGIHQGIDLHAPAGTPVQAVGPGEIVEAGDQGNRGYGRYVILKFEVKGQTYYALYAHLSENIEAKDEKGNPRKVYAGERIGATGTSGNAEGMEGEDQHLHFEMATDPTFGGGLGSGRKDPMLFFRAKMKVE